jgi:membrane associated rhomboid family serine protease/Flp pilus assembly protein TadD
MANCVQCGRKLPPLTIGRKICQWCVQHERAQRGEEVEQRVMAAPWVRHESSISLTKLLFGANVAVFIAMVFASGSIEAFPGAILGHFGANWGPYTLAGDWWRLVTYMFLHIDIWHIAFNMWCLWDLGALCESLYGTWTFGAVYLITGVAGGLASVAWHPLIPSVGASGAIFGLAGALIASLYLGEFSLPSFAIQANMRSLLFFVGFNILFGISAIGDLVGIHVDNACHIGGLVSGLILGALIARLAADRDNSPRRIAVLAVVALAVTGSAFAVRQWRGTPYRMERELESMSQGSPDRALAKLEAIARQQPNSVGVHFALGRTYFSQQQFPQAETEFKRVIELQPQNTDARVDLGMTYLNETRLDDASNTFSQAVAQNSTNADAHYGLGLTHAAQENHPAAIEEYKKAIQLDPQITGAEYELGRSYAKLKNYDDAIAAYLKEKEHTGDDPDLEAALAEAYAAQGMSKEADEAKAKATQLKDANTHPH